MFKTMLTVFEPETGASLDVSMAYGPRAVARGLSSVFNGAEWDDRHLGTVACLIADYTAGEKVDAELIREIRRADLHIVLLK